MRRRPCHDPLEAGREYGFLKEVKYMSKEMNDGSTAEKAVVINAISSHVGIAEEYAYLERVCGKTGVDYTLVEQRQMDKNGREYDVLEIELKDGSVRSYWFDITSFFGRW